MRAEIRRKIIAVFMDYLPGRKSGGPLKRVINMVDALGDTFDIYVVSRDHDFGETKRFDGISEGWNQVGKARVMYLSDNEINTKRYGHILDEIKADMVYTMTVFSVGSIFPCIRAARKRSIPILIAPCGQTCHNSLMLKRWKKIPYLMVAKNFRIFDDIYFHTTSQEEYDSMKKYLGIKEYYLSNIPNIPRKAGEISKAPKNPKEIKMLFISRIHRKKNLLFALEVLQKVKCQCTFDIYGPIEDKEYWVKCEDAISMMPRNVTVTYKGALKQDEAELAYQSYDAFFFPTLSENYGFVIEEALLSDCPVILSRGTTPWDDYEPYVHTIAELGDYDSFVGIIEHLARMSNSDYLDLLKQTRIYVSKKIAYNEIVCCHKEMMEKVIESKNN